MKRPNAKLMVKTAAQKSVEKFEKAQHDLNDFMVENEDFIMELRQLVDEHNATLKEAQMAIKSELANSDEKKLKYGPLAVVKKMKDYWDGNKLVELLPATVTETFLEEIITYKVNVERLEQLIRQEEIKEEQVRDAFVLVPPQVAMSPGCPKELMI